MAKLHYHAMICSDADAGKMRPAKERGDGEYGPVPNWHTAHPFNSRQAARQFMAREAVFVGEVEPCTRTHQHRRGSWCPSTCLAPVAPKPRKVATVSLPLELAERLDAAIAGRKLTRSTLVRRIVAEWLDSEGIADA